MKSSITSEIGSFITLIFAENDTTELSVGGRARQHLKVVLASTNMKSSIIQGARLNYPTNVCINEYLTQKRPALLYKLRVIKKDNPAIGSVYTRNGSIYYKLDSDKNKKYIVNEESDLSLINLITMTLVKKVTSSKKTSNSQFRLNSKKYCFQF